MRAAAQQNVPLHSEARHLLFFIAEVPTKLLQSQQHGRLFSTSVRRSAIFVPDFCTQRGTEMGHCQPH